MYIQRVLSLLAFTAIVSIAVFPSKIPQVSFHTDKIDPWVLATAAAGNTEFLVFLAEQADLSAANSPTTKLEKGTYVYETLTGIAARTQGPLLAALDALGAEYRSYWVANMVWVRGDQAVVEALAQRPDVAHIYANPVVRLAEPEVDPLDSTQTLEAIEWNISHVGAPAVWAEGFNGQGVVIGGQDTGYDWDHPALIDQYCGWNGATADHNYSWHDAIHANGGVCGADSPEPCDDHSHGTHTMGTMVGDDGGSNQIGMAPGARWIGCRNMDRGNGTPATYAECYQWFIAPTDLNDQNPNPAMAPDVINNSWSCPPSEGCTDPNVLLAVVQNIRAAGILTVHSAGNDGSLGCSSVADPAAIYDESFTVGSTTSSDNISSFSSRGPVTRDGSNRLKPDISAPGSGIRSSVPGGGYASGWSGTSMAAPHVAGQAALIIAVDPGLAGQVDLLEDLIRSTAVPLTSSQVCGGVPGSHIPNNTFGSGRIDALAAHQGLEHRLDISKSAAAPIVAPGELLTYTLSITHTHLYSVTSGVSLTDTVPADTTFINATAPFSLDGQIVTWDVEELGPDENQEFELVVLVSGAAVGQILNAEFGVLSNEVAFEKGSPVVTIVWLPLDDAVHLPIIHK